jgi:pimeloyl-ACP methyl ester carboxylesterase|tara:strand:+ start:110 stop:895 length:786 start_codon:yes stop_codon:yes gene_type:complete
MKTFRFVLVVFIGLAFSGLPGIADAKTGVILMHGKGGTSKSRSPVGKLVSKLENAGFLVAAPDMPWSRSRGFDKNHTDSMSEIDKIIAELKSDGATKIVVGGHSIGANAALAYAARHEGLAGVLAIAPGHIPEIEGFQGKIDFDYKRAKKMVDAGKGGEEDDFKDTNQGRKSTISTSAEIYLSWFDPKGPAAMPTNTANLKPGTPLMWIIGEKDRMMDRGEGYAFAKAPVHDNNAYVVVKGGHGATPIKGAKKIIDWLKGL